MPKIRLIAAVTALLVAVCASAATYTVVNTADSGTGSLRQAILDANAAAGGTVAFNIPSAPFTITLLSGLPDAAPAVIIDGSTQPGYSGSPIVEINGSGIPSSPPIPPCITTRGTVKALVVNRCPFVGIAAYGAPVISANHIGTNVAGGSALGNNWGIYLRSPGSGALIDGNVISGNEYGIRADEVSNFVISNNKIGTDRSGSYSVANATGMWLGSGSNITINSNVISGNTNSGILALYNVSAMTIKNNAIGVGPGGNAIGNGYGIATYDAYSNTIGDLSGGGNVIANNGTGISVFGDGIWPPVNNVIRGNSFYNNAIGIDLGQTSGPGVTPNDPGDGDSGGNTLQNYPLLTSVSSFGGSTTIGGTFNSTPSQSFTIDFYTDNAPCSGNGQGRFYLGSLPLTTDGSGNATINTTLGATTVGHSMTALAVDATGNTSEFSPCAAIQANGVVQFASGSQSVSEAAGSLAVTVTRIGTSGSSTVNYVTTSGTASAGSDFTTTNGNLSFADGEASKTITVPIIQDTTFEGSESFTVTLSGPTGSTTLGSPSSTTITILEDDPMPSLSIADVQQPEGNSGTTPMVFTVTLSVPAGAPVSLSYQTGNNTASSDDYQTICCPTLTFNPGETSKTIAVNIIGDTGSEADETFNVFLSNASNATFSRSAAAGTILNDDAPLVMTVSDVAIAEGDSGLTNAVITFTANAPVSGSIDVFTEDGTAKSSQDYTQTFTSVSFSNQTMRTISIPIAGDAETEPDEVFYVRVSSNSTGAALNHNPIAVTILNDDAGFGPKTLTVPLGGKASFLLILGAAPGSPVNAALTSTNPEVLAVPASVALSASSNVLEFAATGVGTTTLTVTLPAPLSKSFTADVRVFEPANLVLTPSTLTIPEETTLTVSAAFVPPLKAASPVQLKAADPSIIDVQSLLVIEPGATATFTVKALKKGSTGLITTISPLHGGTQNTILVDVVEAAKTPLIAQVVPANGPAAGGTSVMINGANLEAGCTLFFGGVPAANVAFVNTSSMTATTPPHAAGSVDVVLSCSSDGFTFANGFTYVAASPAVSAVAPSFGSIKGGTLVDISGTNFRSGCWPFFDNVAATAAVFVSATEMTAEAPPHAAGNVTVAIRCTAAPNGTLANGFTYSTAEEPSALINSVTPLAGAPGQPVTLSGIRFRRDDAVKFDAAGAAILDWSPDAKVVRIPEMPAGNVSITLTDAAGHSTTTGPIFNVLEPAPPQINTATPQAGRPGTDVVLDGTGFRPGYSFAFGTARAALVSLGYTRVVLRVPDIAPGAYPLNVLNAAGKIASIGPSVTVAAAGPSISSVMPACATTDGGGTMTIKGAGFESGAVVAFNGTVAVTQVVDAKTLRITIPAGAAGSARITITNPGGTPASLTGAFTYFSPFDPNGGCSGGRPRPLRH